MKIFLIFILNFTSIHQIEYKKYLKKEIFLNSSSKINYIPLNPKIKGIDATYKYYGYLPYWVDTLYYRYFQMELLTHISYFGVQIYPSTGELGAVPYLYKFEKILNYAHERGVKVHMTFIIFNSDSVSVFLNNPNARQNAIQNIKNFIANYGIDGVNIDFEWVTSSVRDSFNKFISDLSYELWNYPGGRKEVYIATPAVPEWYPGYDIAYLSQYSDGLFIMAYDFHYAGSSVAGPVSPTVPSSFWGEYSVAKTIGSYKVYGADPKKMILGIPYYGYDWPTVSGDIGSSTTGYGSAVIFYYAKQNANTYGRLWDTYSLTPWYRYYSTEWHQCWYDDSLSIDIKLGLVVDSGLAGAGCWALGYDKTEDDIWNVIRKNFWIEAPQRHFVIKVDPSDSIKIWEYHDSTLTLISTAPYGSKLVSFYQKNNFYKIYFPSNTGFYYGWVYGGDGIIKKYIKGSTGDKILRITANLLNVIEGPSISYNIITRVSKGQVFVADSFSGDWARIYIGKVSGFTKGWIYYSAYARSIENPEDSNDYHFNIMSLYYPFEIISSDTFTLKILAYNSGFAPYDSLVFLKSVLDSSQFYTPEFFYDTRRAFTAAFYALPGQKFYIDIKLRAPYVEDTMIISESFFFERKFKEFGDTFQIYLLVLPSTYAKEFKKRKGKISISKNIFNEELILNSDLKIRDIKVFDISGRKIYEYRNIRRLEIGKNLKSSAYFLIIDNRIKLKLIKLAK